MTTEKYDFAVIGAGGTGLGGAMYAARLGMKTIVFGATNGMELPVGGVITTTHVVENYPGFTTISGVDLAKEIEKHTRSYDLVTIKTEKVENIKKTGSFFSIKTNKGNYQARSLLIATGTKWRELEAEGSKDFRNKGVNYCALCDGPLYKKKIVAVAGGGDSAIKDALLLSEHADKVYIIARGKEIKPEPINFERVKKNKKIEVITGTNIKEVRGNKFVTEIVLDKPHNGSNILKVDGIFIAIGHIALSDIAKDLGVKLDKRGEIIIDHKTSETNVHGIFAAGDVTDKPFKQLITGVADACTAAHSAYEYLNR